MNHIHFERCNSTQEYLKENFTNLSTKDENILVSTENQPGGIGRTGNSWDQLDNAIAFSFTISPCNPATLTPLEIGILLCHFFKEKYSANIGLKWPNDLLTNEKHKCAGIICNLQDSKTMIAGVGINVGKLDDNIEHDSYKTPIGSIVHDLSLLRQDKKNLPAEIYQYILDNRLSTREVTEDWNRCCFHQNQQVKIVAGKQEYQGLFLGIGKAGEAIIQEDDKQSPTHIHSGSLFFD